MHFTASLPWRLRQALEEDGAFSDVTSGLIPGLSRVSLKAKVLAKKKGRYCGHFLLKPLFSQLDKKVKIQMLCKDGAAVKPGQSLAIISGKASAILAGERVFLNLAAHLSGIATLTAEYVAEVKGTKTIILDTRKTTPLWRDLERMAVRMGGGQNHRFSLSDAILVKDNHWSLIRKTNQTISDLYSPESLKKNLKKKVPFVEIEACSLPEVWQAIKTGVDIVLLDNMTLDQIKDALLMIESARRVLGTPKPWVEISGGVTLDQVKSIAALGVDRISVGALTHSAPSLDISLEVF